MKEFVEKLRKKPRHVRVQIMWAGVILCMLVIFGFWVSSISQLMALPESADQQNLEKGLSDLGKDIPTLFGSLGEGFSNLVDSFGQDKTDDAAVFPELGTPEPSSSDNNYYGKLPITE